MTAHTHLEEGQDGGASPDGDRALVSDQAAPRLAPSGFDPSRVYRSQGYAMATFDQGRDADGAPLHEVWGFADEDSGSEGDGYLELRIHEIVETQKSGTLAVYYRQWFAPDGEPAFGMQPKRRVGSLASVKALINRRKMTPRDSDGSGEADKTGTGLAEGDSAGPKDIAQGPAA